MDCTVEPDPWMIIEEKDKQIKSRDKTIKAKETLAKKHEDAQMECKS